MGKKEKTLIKVVLDTNILISALIFKGGLSKLVELWKKGKIIPLFSKETFQEFKNVLQYPKFSLTEKEIRIIITEEVLPFFEIIEVTDIVSEKCKDPDDDKFLSCAISASADFIVSGDSDLHAIGKYKFIKIIKASDFLEIFKD